MKKLLLFFSCFPGLVSAQYLFNFEDSTLNFWEQHPSERWIISDNNALSGHLSLQHAYDNPSSGVDFIAFYYDSPELSDTLNIEFRIKHAYNPSTNNNWQVSILNSMDKDFLSQGKLTDGIYMGVNLKESGDFLKIWQVKDELLEELLNTGFNYQEKVGTGRSPYFRLSRYPNGRWELFCNPDGDPAMIASLGISGVSDHFSGRHFLIRYAYSSAQDRKLWFDDLNIEGHFFIDREPPRIMSQTISGLNGLIIEFDEQVFPDDKMSFYLSENVSNPGIFLTEDSIPASVEVSDKRIMLTFEEPFTNRHRHSLDVKGIRDTDGNSLQDTIVYFLPNRAEWGDVVINEIMFDPYPSVNLPECEYIELYNQSDWDLSINSWSVEINGKHFTIAGDSILTDGYLLLTGPECSALIMALGAIPCFSSASVLSNTGGQIVLYDQYGSLIHLSQFGVPMEGSWKEEGGWSVERMNPESFCNYTDNIGYSDDPSGGSPGRINSNYCQFTDELPPYISHIGINDSLDLELSFSELIDRETIKTDNFLIIPGDYIPDSVILEYPWFNKLRICLPSGVLGNKSGTLKMYNVSDCEGNFMEESSFEVGLPVKPESQYLLISEVMYDPFEGAPEFIELYNHSSHFLDLKDVMIAVSDADASPDRYFGLSKRSHIIAPGDYLVLCPDVPGLRRHHNLEVSGRWIVPDHLPALVNSGGSVYLFSRSGEVLDFMTYGDEMHLSLVEDSKGISLERISFETWGSDPTNWHSASSSYNYASPGEPNSQFLEGDNHNELLSISPKVFSPDNDGFEDVLEIYLNPSRSGFVLQMQVIDMSGALIRNLSNNDILGSVNKYYWDGQNDFGTMVPEGMYLLYAMLFNPDGHEKVRIKKAFALIYR